MVERAVAVRAKEHFCERLKGGLGSDLNRWDGPMLLLRQ